MKIHITLVYTDPAGEIIHADIVSKEHDGIVDPGSQARETIEEKLHERGYRLTKGWRAVPGEYGTQIWGHGSGRAVPEEYDGRAKDYIYVSWSWSVRKEW